MKYSLAECKFHGEFEKNALGFLGHENSRIVPGLFEEFEKSARRHGVDIFIDWNFDNMRALDRGDKEAQLFPAFHREANPVGFWIGVYRAGELIGTAASINFDTTASLYDFVVGDGMYQHLPGDRFAMSGPAAKVSRKIHGPFVFSGNYWAHQGLRGTPFSAWVIKDLTILTRALGQIVWGTGHVFTFVRTSMVGKVAERSRSTINVPSVVWRREGKLHRSERILSYTCGDLVAANVHAFLAASYTDMAEAA